MFLPPTSGRAPWRRGTLRLALAGAVLAFAGTAGAADFAGGTLTVARDADTADCPDEAELGRATLALGTPPPERAAQLQVSVVFQRDAFGYGAIVRTVGPQEGLREIRKPGPTCAALAEAVSVVLAVVFDLAPLEAAEPSEPPAPAPALPPVVPSALSPQAKSAPQAPPRPVAQAAPASPLTLGVDAQGGAAYRLLGPVPVGVLALTVRPSIARWELGAGVLWAPLRTADYLGRSVYLSVLAGRLEGCGWLLASRSRLDVAVCAGALLGRLRGRGDGFDYDFTSNDVWLAAEAGLAGRFPLTHNLALRFGIFALVPARRHSFLVAGAGRAFRSSSVAGFLQAGPELRFP